MSLSAVLTGTDRNWESLNKRPIWPLVMQVCTTSTTFIHNKRVKVVSNHNSKNELTAGSAKKEMANTEKHEATIFPGHVLGTVSP